MSCRLYGGISLPQREMPPQGRHDTTGKGNAVISPFLFGHKISTRNDTAGKVHGYISNLRACVRNAINLVSTKWKKTISGTLLNQFCASKSPPLTNIDQNNSGAFHHLGNLLCFAGIYGAEGEFYCCCDALFDPIRRHLFNLPLGG